MPRLGLLLALTSLLGCRTSPSPAVVPPSPTVSETPASPTTGASTVTEAIARARALVGTGEPAEIYATVLECYYGRQSVSVNDIVPAGDRGRDPFNPIPLGADWVKTRRAARDEVDLLAYSVIPTEEAGGGEALVETLLRARPIDGRWRIVAQTERGQSGCWDDAWADLPLDPVLGRCRTAHARCVVAVDTEDACGGMGGCACNSCLMGLESCDQALSACAGLVVGPAELCEPVDDCRAEHHECQTFVERSRAQVERLFEDDSIAESPECIFVFPEVDSCEAITSTLQQEPCQKLVQPR